MDYILQYLSKYSLYRRWIIAGLHESWKLGSQCSLDITAATQLLRFLLVIVNGVGFQIRQTASLIPYKYVPPWIREMLWMDSLG